MDTSRMAQLRLEYLSPAELKPEAHNPRKHPKSQIKVLARAIKEFGFTSPILVDCDNTVIAGHCRLLAAQDLGIVTVPIVRLEHLSPTQLKAYRIADNRLAELADWDTVLLKQELQAIAALDLDFDLTLTGFELPKLDILMNPVVDIGYKKPPKHSRFQKGKSGNPKGRPKNRSPNMTEVLDNRPYR